MAHPNEHTYYSRLLRLEVSDERTNKDYSKLKLYLSALLSSIMSKAATSSVWGRYLLGDFAQPVAETMQRTPASERNQYTNRQGAREPQKRSGGFMSGVTPQSGVELKRSRLDAR